MEKIWGGKGLQSVLQSKGGKWKSFNMSVMRPTRSCVSILFFFFYIWTTLFADLSAIFSFAVMPRRSAPACSDFWAAKPTKTLNSVPTHRERL